MLACRQAVVSWTTSNQTASPIVQYGTASGTYTNNATAAFDSYSRSDMCGSIANSTGWTDPGKENGLAISLAASLVALDLLCEKRNRALAIAQVKV